MFALLRFELHGVVVVVVVAVVVVCVSERSQGTRRFVPAWNMVSWPAVILNSI